VGWGRGCRSSGIEAWGVRQGASYFCILRLLKFVDLSSVRIDPSVIASSVVGLLKSNRVVQGTYAAPLQPFLITALSVGSLDGHQPHRCVQRLGVCLIDRPTGVSPEGYHSCIDYQVPCEAIQPAQQPPFRQQYLETENTQFFNSNL